MNKIVSSLAVIGLCVSMVCTNPIVVYSEQSKSVAKNIESMPISGSGVILYPKLSDEEKEELIHIATKMLYSDRNRDSLENARDRANIINDGYLYEYVNRWGITDLTDEERDLLANIVWLEAGNQSLEGQEYVVVTILNRTTDEYYAGDVEDVLSAKDQFETWNSRYTATPTDLTYQAIDDVLSGEADESIINSQFLYFNNYSGDVKIGDHYFSY